MTDGPVTQTVQIVEWATVENELAGDGPHGAGGALLLGNGFSSNIWSAFAYGTLLERSGLEGKARDLFAGRSNFETVLSELSITQRVLSVAAADEADLLAELNELAAAVRDGLLNTVGEVHPNASALVAALVRRGTFALAGVPVDVLSELAKYMPRYSQVFVTNYDLIAYWISVQGRIADLFPGSDPFEVEWAESWLETNDRPKIFFVHGALHLRRSLSTNAEGKHIASPTTALLDVVRASVDDPDQVPLFISEGSSEEKVARIRASQYLSFCTRVLDGTDLPLTVLGQGLEDVDAHIRDAIERHPNRKVAIGVYVGDVEGVDRARQLEVRAKEIQGRLSKCTDVVFFDSAEHPLTDPKLHCR